jgi:hypothetical protein
MIGKVFCILNISLIKEQNAGNLATATQDQVSGKHNHIRLEKHSYKTLETVL